MKEIPTPYQVMEELARYISKAYSKKREKTEAEFAASLKGRAFFVSDYEIN